VINKVHAPDPLDLEKINEILEKIKLKVLDERLSKFGHLSHDLHLSIDRKPYGKIILILYCPKCESKAKLEMPDVKIHAVSIERLIVLFFTKLIDEFEQDKTCDHITVEKIMTD
jgi:hypothetical protein